MFKKNIDKKKFGNVSEMDRAHEPDSMFDVMRLLKIRDISALFIFMEF